MNLVGKVFVLLIFVLALAFMAFSMALYMSTGQDNWRGTCDPEAGSSYAQQGDWLRDPVEDFQGRKREADER